MNSEASATVSAIVVNHNGEGYLGKCLDFLEQALDCNSSPLLEIIVVDNASTDGSKRLVSQRCELIELDRNLGFGAANNIAARRALGEYLLLINSDAWIEIPDIIRLCEALDQNEAAGLAAPQLRYPNGTLQFSWVPSTGVLGEALQKLRNPFEARPWAHGTLPKALRLLDPGWYSAACLLIRATAFRAVSGFDEDYFMYFEDVDFSRRLLAASWTQVGVREATAFHLKGASGTGHPTSLRYRRSQLLFYRKHRPAWENRVLIGRLKKKLSTVLAPDELTRFLALQPPD